MRGEKQRALPHISKWSSDRVLFDSAYLRLKIEITCTSDSESIALLQKINKTIAEFNKELLDAEHDGSALERINQKVMNAGNGNHVKD